MLSETHYSAATALPHQEMGFENRGDDDDFSVDDLLDFPEPNEFEAEVVVAASEDNNNAFVSMKFDDMIGDGFCAGFSPTEISLPADDVAELEWLSHFVDDSFSEYSMAYSVEPATSYGSNRLFPPPLTKPRAKRSRCYGKSWTLSTSVSSSDTTSSSSSTGSTTSSPLLINNSSAKRQNRSRVETQGGGGRRCSHCGVQKTPQWRSGPEGAKTLCNACGVRYKSGRLCPEYRPACSPTFSSVLHSNQHRKVVEMRRKKKVVQPQPV